MILPLALLKARVFLVNDIQYAFATNDLAINATLLNGGSNLHDVWLFVIIYNDK